MTLKEKIFKRRSIRKFLPKEIPESLILELIEVAIQAPSASNSQPWKYLLIKDPKVKTAMYQAVLQEEEIILDMISEEAKKTFIEYGRYFVRFYDAPLIIIPIYKTLRILSRYVNVPSDKKGEFSKSDLEYMENQSAIISVSLAIENILLYVNELGLGASCMTGPLIANQKLRKILSVPSRWHIGAIIPVGYPDEKPESKDRKNVQKVIKWF